MTPVFRLQRHPFGATRIQPYLEAGVGFHLLSEREIENIILSTSFQFGIDVGWGLLWGHDRRVELGYRFQHLSNAGIRLPNPGINFHLLYLGYCL